MTDLKISVIIPSKNRAEQIEICLKALEQQTLSRELFEILVVDDGSTDNTLSIIKDLQQKSPDLKVKIVSTNRKEDTFKAGFARNFGANQASGEILLFLDSDIIAEPHLLENHLSHYHEGDNITVIGYRFGIIFPFQYIAKDLVRKHQLYNLKDIPLLYDIRESNDARFVLENGIINDNLHPWRYYHSHNISVKKADFLKVSGFDESFVGWGDEDLELGYRLWEAGLKFVFDREVMGFHLNHYFDKKKNLLSEFDNKRYTLKKHQTLEIELFNDDTNPAHLAEKDLYLFKHLKETSEIPKSKDKLLIPQEILETTECVIGEGSLLEHFKSLKYLINIREKMPYRYTSNAEHFKIIGSLLPLKTKSLKKIVIYNYLDLFPGFYAIKILSEALRCAEEVHIFNNRYELIREILLSFESSSITAEEKQNSQFEQAGYAVLKQKELVKINQPRINFILSSFSELINYPQIINLVNVLERKAFEITIFSTFDFRIAFEKSNSLFRKHAGYLYNCFWKYLNDHDSHSINIYTGLNQKSDFGSDLFWPLESSRDLNSTLIDKLNHNFESIITGASQLRSILKAKGVKVPIIFHDNLNEELQKEPSLEFLYPLSSFDQQSKDNLSNWLSAFQQIAEKYQATNFKVLYQIGLDQAYLKRDFRGIESGPAWQHFAGNINSFFEAKRNLLINNEKELKILLTGVSKKLPLADKLRISYCTDANFNFLNSSNRKTIKFKAGSKEGFIENHKNISINSAKTALEKVVKEFFKTNSVSSLIKYLNKEAENIGQEKILTRNLWGSLNQGDYQNFRKNASYLKATKSLELKVLFAISNIIDGKFEEAKLIFNQIEPKNINNKGLSEAYFAWDGYLKLLINSFDSAIESFEECLKINPGNLMAVLNLAYLKDIKQ